jgi:rhodanese-related sulfurtransferase
VKSRALKDALGMWMLLTGCIVAGLVLNQGCARPLPFLYLAPDVQLQGAPDPLSHGAIYAASGEGDVSLEEMQMISSARKALILDARPEMFYRLGHIPSAISLPRDDFENRYHVLGPLLQAHRDRAFVVYCSSENCEDSQIVGEALQRLGFSHVRLFRGGWSLWQCNNRPEEKE